MERIKRLNELAHIKSVMAKRRAKNKVARKARRENRKRGNK